MVIVLEHRSTSVMSELQSAPRVVIENTSNTNRSTIKVHYVFIVCWAGTGGHPLPSSSCGWILFDSSWSSLTIPGGWFIRRVRNRYLSQCDIERNALSGLVELAGVRLERRNATVLKRRGGQRATTSTQSASDDEIALDPIVESN